jgi:hypothetical protein
MPNNELYVTTVEQEAYDLAGQLIVPPNQVRSHVAHRTDKYGFDFYVVVVDAPEAMDRARVVRRKMFGS